LLAQVRGLGIETADMLAREAFSRRLRDRRAVAWYGGLTGAPDESGPWRSGTEPAPPMPAAPPVAAASQGCPSLAEKRVTPHVLRHTLAMDLLHHGVDRSVIALWLGHESVETTVVYLQADMKLKEQALAKTNATDGQVVRQPLGNSHRRSRWSCADHIRRRPSWTGLGTGTSRCLLPLPATRNRPLVLSMAVTGSGGLADAQAAGIDQAEAAAVDRVADAAQNASHLGMGKRLRLALLRGEPDLF
jgi:hypothetical protein